MDEENIFDKIEELFGKKPDNFSIIEQQIDIKIQLDYFEKSKKIKSKPLDEKKVLDEKERLFDELYDIENKKQILLRLASIDSVEAYRIIEHFIPLAEAEIKDWALLALQESRSMIESSLLNESQIIISTGLGGKGKKLRYFTVLASAKNEEFSDLQKKLIEKELAFSLKKNDGELEKIEFIEHYATVLSIVPIMVSIKKIIKSVVDECNQIGDFISHKYIVTNVKEFSIEEIKDAWDYITD
jgi:hypothetical protein